MIEALLDGRLEAVNLAEDLGIRHHGAAEGIADGDLRTEVGAREAGRRHAGFCPGTG